MTLRLRSVSAVVIAISAAFLRGIKESMVMSREGDPTHTGGEPGVRGHRWFGVYHLIGLVWIGLFGALVWVASRIRANRRRLALMAAGLALLMWEATELGYSLGRTGSLLAAYEHIDFGDVVSWYVTGRWVMVIHAARTVAGVSLIYGGVRL